MAYVPYYTINFTNEQSQPVEVTISKKDGDPDTVVANYEVTEFFLDDKSEGQSKYDSTIITRELVLSLWTTEFDEITWETFITAEHDEWFISVVIDTYKYFEGWLTPDEGNAMFQDKPYEVTIRATNGLALLKETPLVNANNEQFDGDFKLIDYIAGALRQTGLAIPIRVYCRYYASGMDDRALNLKYDMFDQAYLNYRTFLSDATTFVSCYDALKIILDKFCRLEYFNGMWVIKSIADLQYMPHEPDYYTDYDSIGGTPTGFEDHSNYAQVGKNVDIYPINEDQQIYSRFAIKSAKTAYNYVVWPEIPKNNKFERGIQFATGDAIDENDIDNDGNTSEIIGTYKDFTINDWTFGITNISVPSTWPPTGMLPPGVDRAYRHSVYNTYNIEIQREIVLERLGEIAGHRYLVSEGLYVNQNDKIKLSFDWKDNAGGTGTRQYLLVALESLTGGQDYRLDNVGAGAPADGIGTLIWTPSTANVFLAKSYASGEDSGTYTSFSFETPAFPITGRLYICLTNFDPPVGRKTYYRSFDMEYIPFVAGGYVPVKGDYWIRQQNKVFPDVASDEVNISDSPLRVLKGALLFNDSLTPPNWYRYGIAENRHFKDLLNIARFNHSYRRMYAIEGTFNGLTYAPENNQLIKAPVCFHKRYRMVDMADMRDFVLVPPLKMDIFKGWITANLVEVRKDADGDTDGTQLGDSAEFKYLF
jgi:hypothetical protein